MMEISAINTLCYGDEVALRMTAIGCGSEESSSRANGFCYRRLAAGKLIKKWKRSRGNRFFCGTHSASRSRGGEMWLSAGRSQERRYSFAAERLTHGLLSFQLLFLA